MKATGSGALRAGRPDGAPPHTGLSPPPSGRRNTARVRPLPPLSKTVKGGRGGSAHVRSAARSLRRPDPAPRAPVRPRPGPGPRPARAPLGAAGKRPARPRPGPRGGPRAGRAPAPDPARRSRGPRASPRPPPPAAPGRPPPRAAPRSPRRRRVPSSSFSRKSRHFGSLPSRPPSPRRLRSALPGPGLVAPRPQVTGGWRG